MGERRWSIVTGQNDRLAQETLREQYERIARQAIVLRGAVFMSLRRPSRTGWTFYGVQLGRCQKNRGGGGRRCCVTSLGTAPGRNPGRGIGVFPSISNPRFE
jgi:hypothetical protein